MTGYLLLHINMLSLGGQITKIIPKQCSWLEAGYETDCVTDTYKEKCIIFVKKN